MSISDDDIELFIQSKNSLLFHRGKIWRKKGTENFDNTMGSHDGAEIGELVGIYILNKLKDLNIDPGLYRDDGIIITNGSEKENDQLRKKIEALFKEKGLDITAQCNRQVVDFLDVSLDLRDGTHWPYVKENNKIKYVCTQSNHPPGVLQNIPLGINHRLSNISSNKELFEKNTKQHQAALNNGGYNHKLEFNQNNQQNGEKWGKKRQRNIVWFNPPYNMEVKTNIGQEFLKILDESFPKNTKIGKFFNRNTVKISYSTTSNLNSYIAQHNKKILNCEQSDNPPKGVNNCSCPKNKKDTCPLNGRCLDVNIIYQAEISNNKNNSIETYVGLTATTFKNRLAVHKRSFIERQYNQTALSKYIWKLKDKGTDFSIKYKIISRGRPYSPKTGRCTLCLREKTIIITRPQDSSLNVRNEFTAKCPHREKFLLSNI